MNVTFDRSGPKEKIKYLASKIKEFKNSQISLMEVCGTHTMAIAKHAIRSLLPDNINLISGPGCPVCVSDASDVHQAINLLKDNKNIIATFGDMLKVPSQNDSLLNYKNVAITYSPMEALAIAEKNQDKEVIFLGIGFETTTPLIASTILHAKKKNIKNFSVLSMHKTVPAALSAIISDPTNKIQGLILPGHVSAITGRKYFDFILKHNVSGVISGFEALDIMETIYLLVKYIQERKNVVLNNYQRLVTENGNTLAFDTIYTVFEDSDSSWRGIGIIPKSGLSIRDNFKEFDTKLKFSLKEEKINEAPGCICGKILMGKAKPNQCPHFKKLCTPLNPVGPCMVSSEGTCSAYFKYNV